MKQLKPRDKVTQHMTRDGLTLDNQTTGESINMCPAGRPNRTIPQPSRAAPLKRCWNGRGHPGAQQGEAGRQGWREYSGAGHRPGVPAAIHRRGTGQSRAFQVRSQGGKAGG